MNPSSAWTHLDAENNPAMVDVSGKQVTVRTAVAVARLDNLGKGASGAAVQNLQLMLGL